MGRERKGQWIVAPTVAPKKCTQNKKMDHFFSSPHQRESHVHFSGPKPFSISHPPLLGIEAINHFGVTLPFATPFIASLTPCISPPSSTLRFIHSLPPHSKNTFAGMLFPLFLFQERNLNLKFVPNFSFTAYGPCSISNRLTQETLGIE